MSVTPVTGRALVLSKLRYESPVLYSKSYIPTQILTESLFPREWMLEFDPFSPYRFALGNGILTQNVATAGGSPKSNSFRIYRFYLFPWKSFCDSKK